MKSISLIFITLLMVTGCDIIGAITPCGTGKCRPPVEAIAEIQTLGVTLSPDMRPFPEEFAGISRLTRDEDGVHFVGGNGLLLRFSPSLNIPDVLNPDPLMNGWEDHPYVYSFSKEVNEEFQQIRPFIPFNATAIEGTKFAPMQVTNDPVELIVFGNHILEGAELFPVEATHIEIWFRPERERPFTLMKRTPLDSLLAWRNFIKPEIDSPQVTE